MYKTSHAICPNRFRVLHAPGRSMWRLEKMMAERLARTVLHNRLASSSMAVGRSITVTGSIHGLQDR
ncbi:MAG: hypothetical protein F4Z15_02155 [Gammaproteobacteria bacterium]|nr:hypothetical protein [Gammaproteobacteria bacterium]MYJ51247.1 hypothetical protein [Gammaproteobacteria bacterium]